METGESIREKDHGMAVNDEDLVPENLQSIDDLVGFISHQRTTI